MCLPIGIALTIVGIPAESSASDANSSKRDGGPVEASPAMHPPGEVTFLGMCDASGAVPLTARTFAVADDEDNILRVYDAERGGQPLYAHDISEGVGIHPRPRKKADKPPKPPREADIEAATLYGELALWITSHGRDKKGKLRQERFRFFATTLPSDERPAEVVGEAYRNLVEDLIADPRFAAHGLAEAARRSPHTEGGLNLEGMTRRSGGGVYIGLRSPVPNGRALVFVLRNPERIVRGESPEFGELFALDLGGLGVRGLSEWRGRYLVIAGRPAGGGRSLLFSWKGDATPPEPLAIAIDDFNPEGFFTPEGRDEIMLLSDDGSIVRDGKPCKKLKDADHKQFRGRWHRLPWQ